ncbi:CatB-related O-acetyltransferase [Stappia sp. ES.058]|uniref:CatB-related O-acetyltransferase n=1 Tax=Stappia sp. ES.058 TaxID=1881061 RepID=UPI00087D3A62|nr:CatB-related O-acetyltransferase [Stappia sp. ES.058]SDT89250.1 virginiamycin A acetyltransferase [Stappia sp. ES.058]
MHGPDPRTRHPLGGAAHTVFLKTVITRATIEVGDFTYYHDPENAEAFEDRNVLYHFDFIGDRLTIGRFCALATGVRFIMNGANHAMGGFSTYPFNIFGSGWEDGFDLASVTDGLRGDTVVGNDVWIGREATVMPGVSIGDGAIVGAHAVVASPVPPYAVVAGNPARIVRYRFCEDTIETLLDIAWWHWTPEKIARTLDAIRGADLDRLKAAR